MATRCRITNLVGATLSEGVFVPAIGASPKSRDDLRIVPEGGNTWIQLANGTILVPRTDFGDHKRFLERSGRIPKRPQ